MSSMVSLLLMGSAAIGSAACVGAAIFFLQRYNNPEPSVIQQRLNQLKERNEEGGFVEQEQARKLARLYKDSNYQNAELAKKFEKIPFFIHLRDQMQQAGLATPADKFFITNMLLPMGLFLLLGTVTGIFPICLVGFVIAVISYFYVVFKKKQRLAKLVTQLPDALSMITSSLRAGHSFQSALSVVSTELSDPVAGEFSNMVRDINLGIPVKDAMSRMVLRLDSLPDLCMFSTAVLIQREAGGNLAEVLENLGYTIRERFKLKGQISALTGQSRLTGYVLGGAPAFLLTGLSLFMYGYVKPLWETDMGHFALLVAVILQAIGFFIMRKIVDIRV